MRVPKLQPLSLVLRSVTFTPRPRSLSRYSAMKADQPQGGSAVLWATVETDYIVGCIWPITRRSIVWLFWEVRFMTLPELWDWLVEAAQLKGFPRAIGEHKTDEQERTRKRGTEVKGALHQYIDTRQHQTRKLMKELKLEGVGVNYTVKISLPPCFIILTICNLINQLTNMLWKIVVIIYIFNDEYFNRWLKGSWNCGERGEAGCWKVGLWSETEKDKKRGRRRRETATVSHIVSFEMSYRKAVTIEYSPV